MREAPPEEFRNTEHALFKTDATYGMNGLFQFPSIVPGWNLVCICSNQEGWEHVSVQAQNFSLEGQSYSLQSRIPIWDEMCQVKEIFWNDDEAVFQLHPKKEDYINLHQAVLHLWRPIGIDFPIPPKNFV